MRWGGRSKRSTAVFNRARIEPQRKSSAKKSTAPIGTEITAASNAAPNGVGRTAGASIPATDLKRVFFIKDINHVLGFQSLNGLMEMPLQQHPSFGEALKRLGTNVQRISISGAAPTQMIKRFGIAFAPRGPLWNVEDADALRRSPLRIINAEYPSNIYHEAGFRRIMTPAHVAELNLCDTCWLTKATGKWRNAWRKSQKSALKLQHASFDQTVHDWLLTEDRLQQRQKGFRALPHSIIHAYAATNRDKVILFTARQKDNPVAAMLFLEHGPVATYHLGWTSSAGRGANAHYALLMHAADYFAERSITRLDIGTVDTENTPGLARFKIGSGAQVRALGGTWIRMPGM